MCTRPGPVNRLQFAELAAGVLGVVHPVEVRPRPGRERHARAVGHHVPDRGAVLAVARVGGQVLADPVVEREGAPLDQHVHDGRRDRLGGRERAERRLRGDRHLLRVGRIIGGVAPAVPDRPVQDHLPVVAQAQLDRRVHARRIPVPGRLPDPLDGGRVDLGVVLGADGGDCVEVGRNTDSAVGRHARLTAAILTRSSSVRHACFLCNVAVRWCCRGWPTAPIWSV